MRLVGTLVNGQERELVIGTPEELEIHIRQAGLDPATLEPTLPLGPDDDEEQAQFRRLFAAVIVQVITGDFVRTVTGSYVASQAIVELELRPDWPDGL